MNTDIINELQCGIVLCQKDGTMLYANHVASVIFNCPSGNLVDYNILSFIDKYFHDNIKLILNSPDEAKQLTGNDFIYVKLSGFSAKIFKLMFTKTSNNKVLFTIVDYTTNKQEKDNLVNSINQMNNSITRNQLYVSKMVLNM